MHTSPIRVTVWGEYRHEKRNPKVAEIYPRGMHEAIGMRSGRARIFRSSPPTSTRRSTG